MLTLQQMVTPVTEDQALATLLETLSQLGFQATSWQSGSIQLIMLRLFARVWARVSDTVALIAAGGFTTLAAQTSGASGFLTLLARYFYSLERIPAQPTIGKILLTSSAGAPVAGPWLPGDLIVSDSPDGTAGARTYTCTEGGTLGPDSTISIEFKADVAGVDSNIAPATTLYMWTPLVGVTATNPALLPSNTWITTPGEDEEADGRLLLRCLGRWERLTYGNTDGAYVGWALEALPALTRVTIGAAAGDGTVRIIGATALGALDAGQIATIEDYVNGVTDGVGRRPINDIVTAESAVIQTSPALNITTYATAGVQTTIAAAQTTALIAYIGSLPIGGVRLQGTQGRVIFSELVRITQSQVGARSVDFNISSDVLLDVNEIYLPTITIDVQPVAPGT
jgi:uncharacterized phage protein gp47/JayE